MCVERGVAYDCPQSPAYLHTVVGAMGLSSLPLSSGKPQSCAECMGLCLLEFKSCSPQL